METKAEQYTDMSEGKIRAVLILDLDYPDIKKAWVSLRVAGNPSAYWVQRCELFYDDDLVQQPRGQVNLYLSDFVGEVGLPTDLCRPSHTAATTKWFVLFFSFFYVLSKRM